MVGWYRGVWSGALDHFEAAKLKMGMRFANGRETSSGSGYSASLNARYNTTGNKLPPKSC